MRHLGTLIAAIVIGPLAWILVAYGQDRSGAAFAKARSTGAFHAGDFTQPLIYLAVAGILLGLIGTLRFSPLGATVTGVGYVASYAALLIDPKALLKLFRHNLDIAGRQADPTIPIQTGTTLVLGALLLVAVASAGRWRRWPRPPAEQPAGPARDLSPYLSPPERLLSTTIRSTEATKALGSPAGTDTSTWSLGEPPEPAEPAEAPRTGPSGSPWATPLRGDSTTPR